MGFNAPIIPVSHFHVIYHVVKWVSHTLCVQFSKKCLMGAKKALSLILQPVGWTCGYNVEQKSVLHGVTDQDM